MTTHQSRTPYAFDMLTGMTHAPGNATMKEFLDHVDGKEFAMCYVEKKDAISGDWQVVPTDYQALKLALGIDPFCLSDRDQGDPYAERLYKEFKFVFGFKASMNQDAISGMRGLRYSLRWLYPSKKSSRYYDASCTDAFPGSQMQIY